MSKSKKFSEVCERAIRMLLLVRRSTYPSRWATVESIKPRIRGVPQALVTWPKQHKNDVGVRDGVTATEATCVKGLKREITTPRRANGAPTQVSTFFVPVGSNCQFESWEASLMPIGDTLRVEPICNALQITPAGYRHHAALRRNTNQRYVRERHNEALRPRIACV